jgi:hypothetical protein
MLRSIWDTVFGLLVDDGSLAIGIVIALVIAWLAVQSIGDATGWLLLALLAILVVGNLFAAGRKTRARISA